VGGLKDTTLGLRLQKKFGGRLGTAGKGFCIPSWRYMGRKEKRKKIKTTRKKKHRASVRKSKKNSHFYWK